MDDQQLINIVNRLTVENNIDNITRTLAYQRYYNVHKEIQWAYLASFVSRNAGWSMSDLMTHSLVTMLSNEWRRRLFMTFERINWLIFSDVYPQLIVYEWSKKLKNPLFNQLKLFHVSKWMIQQWWDFWYEKDEKKLMNALIINEQHVIEKPVIRAPFFKDALFKRPVYEWQERLHFSVVIFPSQNGELYGTSVSNFIRVKERVALGKKLAWLLFQSTEREGIRNYFIKQPYTANRSIDLQHLQHDKGDMFPFRLICPQVFHHDESREDWSTDKSFHPQSLLEKQQKPPKTYCLTKWYQHKRNQIDIAASLLSHVRKNLGNSKSSTKVT